MTDHRYIVKQDASNGLFYSYYSATVLPTQVTCVGAATLREAVYHLGNLIESGTVPGGSITIKPQIKEGK